VAPKPFPLSPQQRRAVEAPLGAVLVVAGPGAGKTACLIERIRFLVEKLGMAPEHVCAVTFTNKAAEEIALRLGTALGRKAEEVRRGTIHALCAEVLREHPDRVGGGLRAGFGIADEEYQRTVLRQLGHGRRAGQLLQLFGRRRLAGGRLTPGDEQLFAEYQAMLRKRNVLDFDDLVVLTGRLFEECPAVADAVAARWTYVLVDEFQDVNASQYAILRRLAQPHGNLFAVGDDEQSIYSWTGADPRVLSRFQKDLDVTQPIVLDHNHRCSQQIFDVARRLLDENTPLFRKELRANRLSTYVVRAAAFGDDEEEAEWVLRDIAADRDANGLDWGDYAVLYRRHEAGDRLESRFIKAGVPCRLARGRPLADDPVIGYVIAALRLLRDVTDAAAAEAFARKVLPEHVMQRVEAEVSEDTPFLQALRDLAASMRGDPDAKKLWRLVYQVENLAAMRGRHQSLWGLVQELLSQTVGPYRNALEERHADLSDPASHPAAVALAERLSAAQRDRARVVLERAGGLEIGLRGLLFGAGFRLVRYAGEVEQAELDDVRVGPGDAGPCGLALTVFKSLQLLHARGIEGTLREYVTFDLETTDLDTTSCEIVEIAAVRVKDGAPVEEFHSLVKPGRPVSLASSKVHGHTGESLCAAPRFEDVWPRLRAFLAGSTIVAHNGLRFDLPVLRRLAEPLGGADRLPVFDTLPLARSLSGDSVRLSDLAARFGVPAGRAHHALDDARTLAGVYEALERQRVVRARKSALVNLLSYLGLSLVLDGARQDDEETRLLLGKARVHALGRFSDCLEFYAAERHRTGMHAPALEEVVQRLGGRAMMDKLREEVDASRRYPAAVARLEALIEQPAGEPLDAAIERFLTRVALSTSQGADVERHRVNLLTLHSTKGLEFSRVYVVGVEDEQLPGWIRPDEDATHAVEEARRLLYVGMTRARERLVLTRADLRRGKPAGGSRFLEEMGLDIERPLHALSQPAAS
jgi:superfamily I DNA/RNA helicase